MKSSFGITQNKDDLDERNRLNFAQKQLTRLYKRKIQMLSFKRLFLKLWNIWEKIFRSSILFLMTTKRGTAYAKFLLFLIMKETILFLYSYFTAKMINQFTVYQDSHQTIKLPGTGMGRNNLLVVQARSSLLLFKN